MTLTIHSQVFDRTALPRLLGSSEHQVLRPFYATLLQQLREFENFVAQYRAGEELDLSFRAHKLKSSAYMAGALQLSLQLSEVEKWSSSNRRDEQEGASIANLLAVCQSTSRALVLVLEEA